METFTVNYSKPTDKEAQLLDSGEFEMPRLETSSRLQVFKYRIKEWIEQNIYSIGASLDDYPRKVEKEKVRQELDQKFGDEVTQFFGDIYEEQGPKLAQQFIAIVRRVNRNYVRQVAFLIKEFGYNVAKNYAWIGQNIGRCSAAQYGRIIGQHGEVTAQEFLEILKDGKKDPKISELRGNAFYKLIYVVRERIISQQNQSQKEGVAS